MSKLSCGSALVGVAVSLAVCGCAAADTEHPGSSDIDSINQDVQQINTAEVKWVTAVRACPINTRPQVIRCISEAYRSSQFPSAVDKLRNQVEHARDQVDNGDCKTALSTFVTKLHLLSQALDTFRRAPTTGTLTDLKTAGRAAHGAWATSVQAELTIRKAC